MKKIIQVATILVVGVGALGLTGVTASANSQYSAKRSKSVRLVWRKSMKRHAFTANKGARYSRHLGIRYSNNDVTPSVIWYTDAHEKLYKKNKGHNAIYYHVKSADGTLQGWIWRGYLKAPKKATSNAVADPDSQSVGDKTMIRTLFPNSSYNQELSDDASTFIATANTDVYITYLNQKGMTNYLSRDSLSFKEAKYIFFVSKNPNSMKSIEQAVAAQGYDAATRSSLKGWSIGGTVTDLDDTNEASTPGEGLIFLIRK
ncbi:hypothetical protein [Levilactobacillus tujiorum]|uniref:hypothetical protein n=1 Tax=Levilactobacillus tujiorum TaxID=2912243 RepID=UPI001B3B2CC8|nr:hypothetical protein [Levilactobacillus tujiorum]MCH5464907.1 hypothetical protein [Levilactobacillus tujiorum]